MGMLTEASKVALLANAKLGSRMAAAMAALMEIIVDGKSRDVQQQSMYDR